MPFYEYRCEACEHELEALQKISDDPLVYCPECGEASLKKMVSRSAFRLKGTGWYETDFKGDKKADKDAGKAAGSGAKKESASSDGEGSSKKAAKSDSSSSEPMKKSA